MVDKLRDQLDELNAALEEARYRRDRSALNKEIFRTKDLLRWLETRAGYVPDAG